MGDAIGMKLRNETFCGRRDEVQLHVRSVAVEEADAVLALQQRVHNYMPDSSQLVGLGREELLRSLQWEFSIGLYDGETLAAFAVLIFNRPGDGNLGQKMGFPPEECATFDIQFVDPEYRGLGLQAYMLAECERIACDAGAKHGFATVAPGNVFSLRNFQKCGFEVYRRVEIYGGRDRYVMKKKFHQK